MIYCLNEYHGLWHLLPYAESSLSTTRTAIGTTATDASIAIKVTARAADDTDLVLFRVFQTQMGAFSQSFCTV
jgi:hypothetical protein